MYLVSWLHVFPVYMYMWYICELLIWTCIYTTVPYKLYMVENHLIFHMRRNPVIFWKLMHITHSHTSLDGWGDYKQDKCFSCGCNVTAGSANTWLDAVRSCIRMCDHIPGRSPRLSAVTLDKTLSNHVLTAYLLVTGVHVFKCTNWIFVMAWLLLVV